MIDDRRSGTLRVGGSGGGTELGAERCLRIIWILRSWLTLIIMFMMITVMRIIISKVIMNNKYDIDHDDLKDEEDLNSIPEKSVQLVHDDPPSLLPLYLCNEKSRNHRNLSST